MKLEDVRNKWLGLVSILILSTFVLSACDREVEPEPSCNFVRNSQNQRVSWSDSQPVKLYIHQSVPSEYYASIQEAVKEWNRHTDSEILSIVGYGSTGETLPKRDGYSVIYWMDSVWEADRANEQARTTVYWSGSKIFEADIRINAYNFKYFIAESEANNREVHFESLILHELGHVLGLAHNSSEGSVMNVTLQNGEHGLRNVVKAQDQASLSCEYN